MKIAAAKVVLRNCWLRREPPACEVYRSLALKSFRSHFHVGRDESYKVLKCFQMRMKEASSVLIEVLGRIDTNTGFSVGVGIGLATESYLQNEQIARSTETWNVAHNDHFESVEQLLREQNQALKNYEVGEQLLREQNQLLREQNQLLRKQLLEGEKSTENKKSG